MKILLTILAFICFFKSSAQERVDTIKSFERKLKLSDFKAKPDETSKFSAISNISRPFKYFTKNDTLFVKIECLFICQKSWFKKIMNQTRLLEHEQGHFDIAEIEVRKTKKRFIDNKDSFNKGNFKQLINKFIEDQTNNLLQRDILYDKETKLSQNEKKQQEWSKKLKGELSSLNMYWGDYIYPI